MAEPIDIYCGEFTTSPVPLELSLNYCSHSCGYCFANLNKPDRAADVDGIMRMLANLQKGRSLSSVLMRAGAPVLVSNRVDPFANSNYKQALSIFETMTDLGVRYALQTRGGRGIDEFLSFATPSVWYVSIAQNDDAIRKAVEPGAPPLRERYALIEKLVAKGHRVVLGLNPLVPEWTPDVKGILAEAKRCGAEGAWVEMLHLNSKQLGNMPERDKKAIGLPILDRASKRRAPKAEADHFDEARYAAEDAGLEVMSLGQTNRSDFFRPFQEVYGYTFPIMQDFVNACWDNLEEGDVIGFETFADYFVPYLPEGQWPISRYVSAKIPSVLRESKVPSSMTYRQLLGMIWEDARIPMSPSRLKCFAFAAAKNDEGNWDRLTDENGLPYLVFTRQLPGFDEYYVEAA